MPVDERTFAADVKAWVDAILARRDDLPFSRASVEDHAGGRRHDFVLYRRLGNGVALTGEIKMPDSVIGKRGPLDGAFIEDAFEKASRQGSPYYFTWNVCDFALFQTHQEGVPFMERQVEVRQQIVDVRISDDVQQPSVEDALKRFWEEQLERLAALERGEPIKNLPLDLRFIRRLESTLEIPIESTLHAIGDGRNADPAFRTRLDGWMRDEQGWELSDDPDALRDNLDRAARLSCYTLLNRLVFYEVLRRRFRMLPSLHGLTPETPDELRDGLARYFKNAMEASRDYETVFREESFGASLPFRPANCAQSWQRVMRDIGEFDFSRLDYEIIGRMYERLIGPEERHRFGQYYTSPDVVDLINAFCIRKASDRILDPSCGGGTFLVRGYARKRALAQREDRHRSHQEMLAEIYGTDVSAFAAELATINLAVRQISDQANYPQIARRNFFQVLPTLPFIRLPGVGEDATRDVPLPELDAAIGNPPYMRQESLSSEEKNGINALVGGEWRGPGRPTFSGRSDIYVYFFVSVQPMPRRG